MTLVIRLMFQESVKSYLNASYYMDHLINTSILYGCLMFCCNIHYVAKSMWAPDHNTHVVWPMGFYPKLFPQSWKHTEKFCWGHFNSAGHLCKEGVRECNKKKDLVTDQAINLLSFSLEHCVVPTLYEFLIDNCTGTKKKKSFPSHTHSNNVTP